MLKSLAKNSILYYLSTFLTRGISFFLLPLYTSTLSQADYGTLELFSILTSFVIIVFTLQLGQGVARYYNELTSQSDVRKYTSTLIYFAFFSFAIFLILAFIFRYQLSEYLGISINNCILALSATALNGVFYLSQNQLAWKIKPVQEIISSFTYNVVTICFTIYFLVYSGTGIAGIFVAQIIGALAGILLGFLFTKNDYGLVFDFRVLKKLLAFSVPLIPGAMSILIFSMADRICIKESLSMDELGIYSVGNKIASILTISALGVSSALSPLIYKHFQEEETPVKIAILFRVFSSLSFILMTLISIFSIELIHLMTNQNYHEAAPVIPFLLLAIYLNSFIPFFPGLYIGKKTILISVISVSAGILNVLLNIYFIPLYGITAAAVVTAFSFGINFYIQYLLSKKYYLIQTTVLPHFILIVLLILNIVLDDLYGFNLFINVIQFVLVSTVGLILILKKSDYQFMQEKVKQIINR
jgi:O-antigen/teichoic acid export membrane protein